MKQILGVGLGVLLSLGFVGCGTKKSVQPKQAQVSRIEQRPTTLYSTLAERSASWEALRATLNADIEAKGRGIDVKINLQAARGKGIRMSVVKLLFEVARVWFTPEGLTLVDLYNGRYVQIDYTTFSRYLGINIDYGQVEALIMGQVFSPGQGADLRAISKLKYSPQEGGRYELNGSVLGNQYAFTLSPTFIVELITIFSGSSYRVFEAEYHSKAVDRLPVLEPSSRVSYTLYRHSGEQKGRLSLEWRRVELLPSADDLQLEPVIKSKYEEISLELILKLLEAF